MLKIVPKLKVLLRKQRQQQIDIDRASNTRALTQIRPEKIIDAEQPAEEPSHEGPLKVQ
jgi:hypothetical protein